MHMKTIIKIISIALICGVDAYLISMYKRLNEVQEAPTGMTVIFAVTVLLFSFIAWAISLSIADKIGE